MLSLLHEPSIDVERDVGGNAVVDRLQLRQGGLPRPPVRCQAHDVKQVSTLLRRPSVVNRLQLHSDERARLGYRSCDDKALVVAKFHDESDIGCSVESPRMRGGVQAVTGIVTWLVKFDLANLEHVDLDGSVLRL